jgi:hypothetical protein
LRPPLGIGTLLMLFGYFCLLSFIGGAVFSSCLGLNSKASVLVDC